MVHTQRAGIVRNVIITAEETQELYTITVDSKAEEDEGVMNEVLLTQHEFDNLLNYSCTLPTGQTVGKRWKRRIPYEQVKGVTPEWFMGEYVEDPDPEYIRITWHKIIIVGDKPIDKDIHKFMSREKQ
jgi:hypothetical protein